MTALGKHSEWWTYQKRALAYVDILGWKDLIERSQGDGDALDAILEAVFMMDRAASTAKRVQDAYKTAPFSGKYVLQEVTHFSDTVVISCEATKDAVGHLVYVCQQFCNRLLISQRLIPTRGAIVLGDLVHRGNVVFGPALVEAYRLESKVAVNPRVLIAPEVSALLGIRSDPLSLPADCPIFEDRDGWLFLDILHEAGETASYWAHEVLRALREKNAFDLKRPEGELRDSILRKNAWLRAYLRSASQRIRRAAKSGRSNC